MTWWQHVVPQHLLSKLMFCFARIETTWLKNTFIRWFINTYQVDLSEALIINIKEYQHFNDFFTRALKPESRPIDNAQIISPVDGIVSQAGLIDNTQIIQAKNYYYRVENLLANDVKSIKFNKGVFATIYLAPKNYHRIHMPYDAKLLSMTYVPGKLFSVNQTTANNVDGLFAKNERLVCYFDTVFGVSTLVLIGAIFVGSMQTVWQGNITPPYKKQLQHFDYSNQNISLKKGEEIGRFNMGSTIIILMPNQHNIFNLKPNNVVKMGQSLL